MQSLLIILVLGLFYIFPVNQIIAQDNIDTVDVSVEQFIDMGIEHSNQLKFERSDVKLAENKVVKARSLKYLPDAQLKTQHGLVPGVKSDSVLPSGKPLPDDQLYLDPNLDNDFGNLNLFTQGEVTALQPIFTWGAVNNAIKAAQSGAVAARERFSAKSADMEVHLFQLYYSYVLAIELERLIEKAQNEIENIDEKLTKMEKEGDPDLDISDVYKFRIFKTEFQKQVARVKQNTKFIKNTWDWILQSENSITYLPADRTVNTLEEEIKPLTFYRQRALAQRYELDAIDASIEAASFGLNAVKAQNLPMLFLGMEVKGAFTPNRPRQDNPFIRNNSNFFTAGVGFGFRQNLNFFSIKSEIQKSTLEYKKVKHLRNAAVDGIVLEINEKYKQASIALANVKQTEKAFDISKKWERQEQLDYDLGFGEPKDLVESIRTKMELEIELNRNMHQFNLDMAQLYRAAGIPLETLYK